MSDRREIIQARLDAVAAQAKIIAVDYAAGRYWSTREAQAAINQLREQLHIVAAEMERRE